MKRKSSALNNKKNKCLLPYAKEIYVSTDIEADGPIPGEYSMLSFGSAAFTADKEIISTFSVNLEVLPRARRDNDTMLWWKKYPKAWEACRLNPQRPKKAMASYRQWLDGLGKTPVFVGYPASFDFSFIYWYLVKFTGGCPFTYVALDIKSYAAAVLRKPFSQITKSTMPKTWFDTARKSHVALEDAIDQGRLFCNMLAANSRSAT